MQPNITSGFSASPLLSKPSPSNLHICTRMCSPMSSPLLFLNVLQLRTLISDFAIIITILVFCGLDCLLELDTPKLHVPTEIKVHSSLNISPHSQLFKSLLGRMSFPWLLLYAFEINLFLFLCEFISVHFLFSPVFVSLCLHHLCVSPDLSHYTSCLSTLCLALCVRVCVWGGVAEEANQWFCHLHVNHVLCGSGYVDGVRHTQTNRSNRVQGIWFLTPLCVYFLLCHHLYLFFQCSHYSSGK